MAGRYRRPTSAADRAKAAEARETKLAGLHKDLTEQVAALATGPEWRRWLDAASKFHSYSFNNTLLLLRQRPEATRVAGYTLWKELGRQVTKGEKGLMILAPVTRKMSADDEASDRPAAPVTGSSDTATPADEPGERRIVGFRPAYVWDVAQTSGDPLPVPPMPQLLAGEAPAGLWDALTAQCEAAGFTVARREIAGENGPNGFTDYRSHDVVVRSDVDDAQATKTLAHELGHVLLHDPSNFAGGQTGDCRGIREVEAESVAYLVAADHGLDTSGYTFAYVATWAAQSGDVEAALRDTGTRILRTAHQVLDKTHDALAAGTGVVDERQAAVASDADQLAARSNVGAARTAALRAGTEKPNRDPEQVLSRDRLLAANDAALAYYREQYLTAGSWAPAYVQGRLGTSLSLDQAPGIGYAPAGWTNLVDQLRRDGFTDAELLGAGLATQARTGRLVDRFRDRLMFPIRDRATSATGGGTTEVVGFVGRRNPQLDMPSEGDDLTGQYLNPKYLNTATTALYTKGEHLYGRTEAGAVLARGGLVVLSEGPFDKLAVDVASRGMFAGVASLGTALTDRQASQLRELVGEHVDQVVVARDGDAGGLKAAARDYEILTRHGLDPRAAIVPAGSDPARMFEERGPAALIDAVATAKPLSRQLAVHAVERAREHGVGLSTIEGALHARRAAAAVLVKAPPESWPREIPAVAAAAGLDPARLQEAVVEAVGTGDDPLGRLVARDRRDDLDRGQHLPPSAADVAALSAARAVHLKPPAAGAQQPVSAAAAAQQRTNVAGRR